MIVRDAVSTVRSMVTGALLDEISVLAEPYDPATDHKITLKYPKRAIAQGSVLCVGLNTFMAMNVSSDGGSVEVLPSMDGGPNVPAPALEIVRVRPQFTTWAIFRELQSEIDSMSSPDVGLYFPRYYEFDSLDRVNGTYILPSPTPASMFPFRLLKAEYRIAGTDAWQTFTEAQFLAEQGVVRVFYDPPGAIAYRFALASAYGQMAGLDDNLDLIGVSNYVADIPMLGAAATMALGWEGRRVQPQSQGDSRRATEVQVGSNASLSRQFIARQKESINAELARLSAVFGYRQPNTSGATNQRYGGGWR